MDVDYKKYSLEQLDNWVTNALTSTEATPQEIYDTIKNAVDENYHTFKLSASRCYDLLSLLNGNGIGHIKAYDDYLKSKQEGLSCDKDDPSPECKKSWNDFWEENYYPEEVKIDSGMRPWGHSDLEYLIANPILTEDRISNFPGEQYTEEQLNVMCEKAASDDGREKCREYNLREVEYYNKRAELDLNNQISRNDLTRLEYKDGLIYESPDGGKTVYSRKPGEIERTLVKVEKVNKWVLPVGVDGLTGDCFVNLPDDLLELANLKEGDIIQWIDNNDGSFTLTKKPTNELN